LDYISHQRRLMPMLANCYAYRLMGHYLLDLYKSTPTSTHTHHRTRTHTIADVTLA
jgi:hypothetical protein